MKLIRNSIFLKILFFVTLGVVSYLAFTTREIKAVEHSWDKLNHLFAFFVLYILFSFSYEKISLFYRLSVLLFYAIFIEVVQSFIPAREASFLDISADMIGMGLGYVAIYILDRKMPKNI